MTRAPFTGIVAPMTVTVSDVPEQHSDGARLDARFAGSADHLRAGCLLGAGD